MKSSGSYGEKFNYQLPHTVSKSASAPEKKPQPAIEQDVYAKQEQQFEQV